MRQKEKIEYDPLELLVGLKKARFLDIDEQATVLSIAGKPVRNLQWAGHVLLDAHRNIISYTIVTEHIDHCYKKQNQLPFAQLLDACSHARWDEIATMLQRRPLARRLANLYFSFDGNDAFAAFCIIEWWAFKGRFSIWFLREGGTTVLPAPQKPLSMPRPDYDLIVSFHDFILENLSEKLPNQGKLTRHFNTNENKLKTGFKQLYKTSIHQFYIEQRLWKAWGLLLDTELPLGHIAEQCGYNTYHNFSSYFKKLFKFPPMSVRRSKPLRG